MSHRETISLAHTAQCKLQMAADKPDRNLRFILGHALTLDSLNLRLIQIEQESRTVQQPSHSSRVKFQASGGGGIKPSPLSGRRKSPTPPSTHNDVHEINAEEDDSAEDPLSCGAEDEGLSLTRFPSGAAQPPRHIKKEQPKPKAIYNNENSSSDDEELESFLELIQQKLDPESLKKITKTESDESLATLYNSIQKCPCHKTDAPKLEKVWDVHLDQTFGGEKGFDDLKFALAEIMV